MIRGGQASLLQSATNSLGYCACSNGDGTGSVCACYCGETRFDVLVRSGTQYYFGRASGDYVAYASRLY